MTKLENTSTKSKIGDPMDRVDGRLKVTGAAKYAAEFAVPNLAYGALAKSTIAKGRVTKIDTSGAMASPGVIAVITHENKPESKVPGFGEKLPLLDPEIHYSGQTIAVVVADSYEAAEYGAERLQIEYDTNQAEATLTDHLGQAILHPGHKRGDADQGMAAAADKVEATYTTPTEHHNPLEPHATLAVWNGDNLLLYNSTQGVSGTQQAIAGQLMMDPAEVRVVDPFVGGGFGCKGTTWTHVTLAALAAKAVGRPVLIELRRKDLFTSNGHRAETRQTVAMGADSAGKLTAIKHIAYNHASIANDFVEGTGEPPASLYSCPNVHIGEHLVHLDVPPATFMRAPGWSSGSWGQETAMDELAYALGLDPLELRLRNHADTDESKKRPWTSKHLRECYLQAGDKFGWSARNPRVGSMKKGRLLVGCGMATASYPSPFGQSQARATLHKDGSALIECGTQDLGTGTYTILTQIAAETLGLDSSRVRVEIADTNLPPAPLSAGSVSATTTGSAVLHACRALIGAVLALASADPKSPVAGLTVADVTARDGRLASAKDPHKSAAYAQILEAAAKRTVQAEGLARPENPPGGRFESSDGDSHSGQGFGAHFCEVHVDADLRTIRVARWVGAFALGRVLNAKTLTSQLQGGIVWGIGMGLMEETYIDPHFARFLNSNLAEYHVPTNKDVPDMEIILVAEDDTLISPIGAKGAGEIGITGVAAAIGNAVYHATGKRVRDLPITLDKII